MPARATTCRSFQNQILTGVVYRSDWDWIIGRSILGTAGTDSLGKCWVSRQQLQHHWVYSSPSSCFPSPANRPSPSDLSFSKFKPAYPPLPGIASDPHRTADDCLDLRSNEKLISNKAGWENSSFHIHDIFNPILSVFFQALGGNKLSGQVFSSPASF